VKRKTAVVTAVLGLLGLLAEPAWRQLSRAPGGPEMAAQEVDILARVFAKVSAPRQQRCASPDCSVQAPWSGFCIGVADADPTPDLLAQLNRLPAAAKPASACMVASAVGKWRTPPAGHLLLWARRPTWLSGGLVLVEAGDYLGPLAATGYRITMLRAYGRWWALRTSVGWVS
jgi:hypothetical protein